MKFFEWSFYLHFMLKLTRRRRPFFHYCLSCMKILKEKKEVQCINYFFFFFWENVSMFEDHAFNVCLRLPQGNNFNISILAYNLVYLCCNICYYLVGTEKDRPIQESKHALGGSIAYLLSISISWGDSAHPFCYPWGKLWSIHT